VPSLAGAARQPRVLRFARDSLFDLIQDPRNARGAHLSDVLMLRYPGYVI